MATGSYLNPSVEILCCEYRERLENWVFRDAAAPYWRLYWNGESGAVLEAGGRDTRMTPEALTLIPADMQFSTRSEQPFSHLFLHFRTGPPYTRVIPRFYHIPRDAGRQQRVEELCTYLAIPARDTRRISLAAHSLVFDVLRLLPNDAFSEAPPLDPRVEQAMALLESSTGRIVANDELAEHVGMTPNALVRLFTRDTGISPQKYSRRQRVNEAALLLHYSDLGIADIAAQTGFLDRYHFTRVFTQLQGQSPARFRKNRV